MSKDTFPNVYSHTLQTVEFGEVQCLVFEFSDQSPVTALVIGDINSSESPLVRIHSRCLYAEVFRSSDCDCQDQRDLAFHLIKAEGAGVFIYLEQEGRACGLLNKAKAYIMKETEGLDTVAAYQKLGLDADPRTYTAAAKVLKYLGLRHVRLLTNNPQKASGLIEGGIAVERVHLRAKPTIHNIEYLKAKQFKLGHDLGLTDDLDPLNSKSDQSLPL